MKRGFGENGDAVNGGLPARRSPLAWFPSMAMNLLAFFADAGSAYSPPDPASECQGNPDCRFKSERCCSLACQNIECPYTGGDKSTFTCPPNYHRTMWTCFDGTRQIACGECSCNSTTCYIGPFACSIWYYTGGTKC